MDNILKSVILTPFNILYKWNPKLELKLLFRLKCGYKLNLEGCEEEVPVSRAYAKEVKALIENRTKS